MDKIFTSFIKHNRKYILTVIVISILILIMISFSFPDLFAMYFVPNHLFDGNIYSWVNNYKSLCPWVSATWPPLYYYVFGAYIIFIQKLSLLSPSLFTVNQCPFLELTLNQIFLFWAKLPFLLFHLASAWLYSQFFQHRKFLWFLFWLLNPIAIFVNFIMGQFDSVPTFFLLLALYFTIKKNNLYIAAFALGIGAAFKHYPFLLLLPFLLISVHSIRNKIFFILLAITPYILTIIPVFNKDFIQMLLFSENQKMLESGLTIWGIHISYYLVLYGLLLLHLLFNKQKSIKLLIKYSLLFTIIYFFTTYWFSQRMLFLLPSLLIFSSMNIKVFRLLPILSLAFFIYTFFMFPGLFDHTLLRPVFHIVNNIPYNMLPLELLKKFVFSGMFLLMLFISFTVITNKEEEEYLITQKDIIISVTPLLLYLAFLLILSLV